MCSYEVDQLTELFSYNIVFIFMLVKAMTFLPKLKEGTAGAFTVAEGLMAGGLAAVGKKVSTNTSNVVAIGKGGLNSGLKEYRSSSSGGSSSSGLSGTTSRVPSSRLASSISAANTGIKRVAAQKYPTIYNTLGAGKRLGKDAYSYLRNIRTRNNDE